MNCSPHLNSQSQERPDWYVLPSSTEKAVLAYIRGRALSTICDESQSQRFELNSEKLEKVGVDPEMNNALAGYAAFRDEELDISLINAFSAKGQFESEDKLSIAA